ncbi:hypothetical protein C6P46_000206, partial [Rhodotorula mucilaginosa]
MTPPLSGLPLFAHRLRAGNGLCADPLDETRPGGKSFSPLEWQSARLAVDYPEDRDKGICRGIVRRTLPARTRAAGAGSDDYPHVDSVPPTA